MHPRLLFVKFFQLLSIFSPLGSSGTQEMPFQFAVCLQVRFMDWVHTYFFSSVSRWQIPGKRETRYRTSWTALMGGSSSSEPVAGLCCFGLQLDFRQCSPKLDVDTFWTSEYHMAVSKMLYCVLVSFLKYKNSFRFILMEFKHTLVYLSLGFCYLGSWVF